MINIAEGVELLKRDRWMELSLSRIEPGSLSVNVYQKISQVLKHARLVINYLYKL